MTELTLAGRQNGSFHEAHPLGSEIRWLMDEWQEALVQLPLTVSAELGIPTPHAQREVFCVPADFVPDGRRLDDPRMLLAPVYARLMAESDYRRPFAEARAAELFERVWRKDAEHIRQWWREGYFPRTGAIELDGAKYQIYNHSPVFAFTGDVLPYSARNLRTGVQELWLQAEFSLDPLVDGSGDFIPNDPNVPVVILPCMSYEKIVDRPLVNAHLEALRGSIAPWVAENYAPRLKAQPSLVRRAMAQLAVFVSS